MKKLFCFGMGYSATLLARQLKAAGWAVAGTVTKPEKQIRLAEQGFGTAIFTRESPVPASLLDGTTHLVSSVPPDENGDPVVDVHGTDIAHLATLEWAALLSTTGVYGDWASAWVDEESELRATEARSVRRVLAEAQWRSLHEKDGAPVHIFRLAGIYGPGRNPLNEVRAGRARRIVKPDLLLSRIHQEDIVGALRASMAHPHPGTAYNVTDDEPVAPHAVIEYGSRLLGVEPPPLEDFATAEMTPLARSFYLDHRRVKNERLKEELGYALRYPTYRDGLKALLKEPPAPPRRR